VFARPALPSPSKPTRLPDRRLSVLRDDGAHSFGLYSKGNHASLAIRLAGNTAKERMSLAVRNLGLSRLFAARSGHGPPRPRRQAPVFAGWSARPWRACGPGARAPNHQTFYAGRHSGAAKPSPEPRGWRRACCPSVPDRAPRVRNDGIWVGQCLAPMAALRLGLARPQQGKINLSSPLGAGFMMRPSLPLEGSRPAFEPMRRRGD
jgi:hypothetical protein